MKNLIREPLGLYLHVPFCAHRCPYCDFYLTVGSPTAAFTDALLREWDALADVVAEVPALATVYLGGGTPGLMEPRELARLMRALTSRKALLADAEVTLEANPNDVTEDALQAWKDAGITRLSLGLQSLETRTLRVLGRGHDENMAREVLERIARAGLRSFSVDLIFGTPGQSMQAMLDDVKRVGELAPHVSAYCLTWEAGTQLDKMRLKGALQPISSDEEADRYEAVRETLGALGFAQYEISSHAKPGHAAVHNRRYWGGAPTLGLGPSAVSYLRFLDGRSRRFRVKADLDGYLRGAREVVDVEEYTPEEAIADRVFTGLRDIERGVNLVELEREHGVPAPAGIERSLEKDVQRGNVERVGPRHYRLTRSGVLFADRVTSGVLDAT